MFNISKGTKNIIQKKKIESYKKILFEGMLKRHDQSSRQLLRFENNSKAKHNDKEDKKPNKIVINSEKLQKNCDKFKITKSRQQITQKLDAFYQSKQCENTENINVESNQKKCLPNLIFEFIKNSKEKTPINNQDTKINNVSEGLMISDYIVFPHSQNMTDKTLFDKNLIDRNVEWEEKKNAKIKQIQNKLEEKKLKECTFSPRVNNTRLR